MSSELKHMDCRNFAPVDVAKGICHRSKELVPADGEHCEHCVRMAKCKFCSHFVATEQFLGVCAAIESKPMTYPDLVAVTCENFKAVVS